MDINDAIKDSLKALSPAPPLPIFFENPKMNVVQNTMDTRVTTTVARVGDTFRIRHGWVELFVTFQQLQEFEWVCGAQVEDYMREKFGDPNNHDEQED